MSMIGIGEILLIAAMVILPCLGLLIAAGIVVAIVLIIRKNRSKST